MISDHGMLIGDRYELTEIAGQGGMATVWRATMHGAAGFTRQVAIKKIRPEFSALRKYIDMFIEEARVGSDLNHPNIVQIHDFVIDEDGSYYLVMEWVEGMDFGSFVRAFTRADISIPWTLVAAAGVGALRGLGAAHERVKPDGRPSPVIHRDVSPHNILIGVNGLVKLTDFGLARARDRVYSLTAPGTVKGKLTYLPPEVTYGQPALPQSDIFSMGNVLWEALTGRTLFHGSTDLEVFRQIRACQVPSLTSLRPDIPEALADIIHRALARDPKARFATARAMARALAEVLRTSDWSEDSQFMMGALVTRARSGAGLRATDVVDELNRARSDDGLSPSGSQPQPLASKLRELDAMNVQFSRPHEPGSAPPLEAPARPQWGLQAAPGAETSDSLESLDIEFSEAVVSLPPVTRPAAKPAPEATSKPTSQPPGKAPGKAPGDGDTR